MKYILSIMIFAIFSTVGMAQQPIGTPIIIKKGETKTSGRLQIKYLGTLEEETFVEGSNGKTLVEVNSLAHLEVTEKGVKREFKEDYRFKTNELVVEIVEIIAEEDAVKIVVMTEKQFGEKVLQKVEHQMAFNELSKIKTFAIGPTGYAAVISQGEKLMLKILASESAKLDFIWILRNGTGEAKLYAMCGLRKLNKKESDRFFEEYRKLSSEVETMSGCDIGKEKFGDVVAQIEKMN